MRTRTNRTSGRLATVVVASMLAAACSGGDGGGEGTLEEPPTTVTIASGDGESSSDSTSTTSGETDGGESAETTTPSTGTEETVETSETTTPTPPPPEPVDLPVYTLQAFDPPEATIDDLLLFDNDTAYRFENGQALALADGPFVEVVTDGSGGVVFQRESLERRVWWQPAGSTGAQELLVVDGENNSLELTGFWRNEDGPEILYQRNLRGGGPENTETTLRSYRFADGSVNELAGTGGWEYGTSFTSVTATEAVGFWGAEGYVGIERLELQTGNRLVPELDEPFFDLNIANVVTVVDGRLLGVVSNGDEGTQEVAWLDEVGLVDEVVAAVPWDNGWWYPSHIFVQDGVAVISRTGEQNWDATIAEGNVLGPLLVDLALGETRTFPYAVAARPLS